MSLRVVYDGQIYSYVREGGVPRYFANVIGRLPADAEPMLLLHRPQGTALPDHPNLRCLRDDGVGPAPLAGRVAGARLGRARRRFAAGVTHPTYYSLVSGRGLSDLDGPVVLTVWDMIHERFRAELDPSGRVAAIKEAAIRAADHVVCISENTRQDVIDHYGLSADRLSVTPLAADIDASMSHGPELVPSRPYFVYVGSRGHAYKNFWRAAEAVRELRAAHPDTALAVVGAPLDAEERRRLSGLGLDGAVEEYPGAGDAHLAKLYRCSVALVYPSLYEGFGIPPLEAMRCGTTVVAGHVASLPEVVGDAGLLVDPSSATELAGAMRRLLDDETERSALVQRGAQRAASFDWDATADATVAIYRSLV